MKKWLLCFLSFILAASSLRALGVPALPDPGPANGGLQLRLLVIPRPDAGKGGYEVHLDLLNVGSRAITLRAGWWHEEDKGDLKDYLEASTSIETWPPITPWTGQVMAAHRTSPQPEYVLKSGEALSLRWQTTGRHLKNKVTDPLSVQDPEFPFPGLYSVHANVVVITGDRSLLLRSNEQLVLVGGSGEMPKHTYGQLIGVDANTRTASLNLGSLHKIAPGDQFRIRTGMVESWKLIITAADTQTSTGRLDPEPLPAEFTSNSTNRIPRFPERHLGATLITVK
jgi:hypothetical protein